MGKGSKNLSKNNRHLATINDNEKVHYRMYKGGSKWLVAGIATFSLGIAFLGAPAVHADTATATEPATTVTTGTTSSTSSAAPAAASSSSASTNSAASSESSSAATAKSSSQSAAPVAQALAASTTGLVKLLQLQQRSKPLS
ncbi:KxYKxGKxW signal peptide domain-containing protein [Secundilactobacillus paracollinoides]|uniref:KxYKxGKxW signal peptide domain-containing protein n=1 Tax=Secundilactobacillus paracollinoides TaxID=240427 RepID=UPI0009E9A369|nr:KxYKxGKxW signal peptide domain-containing protein [Secundilactobacillus paracollinoides]